MSVFRRASGSLAALPRFIDTGLRGADGIADRPEQDRILLGAACASRHCRKAIQSHRNVWPAAGSKPTSCVSGLHDPARSGRDRITRNADGGAPGRGRDVDSPDGPEPAAAIELETCATARGRGHRAKPGHRPSQRIAQDADLCRTAHAPRRASGRSMPDPALFRRHRLAGAAQHRRRFDPVLHVQLHDDIVDMVLDGRHLKAELARDQLVRQAVGQKRQDLVFAA